MYVVRDMQGNIHGKRNSPHFHIQFEQKLHTFLVTNLSSELNRSRTIVLIGQIKINGR